MAMEESQFQKLLYFLCTCISFNCEGGHFVLMPTILAKLFGANGGIRLFSVGFGFIGLASVFNIMLVGTLFSSISFPGFCYIYGTFSLISLFILLFYFK
jgi:hypothetical protein